MDATAPELDEFDILRRGSRWAALAPLDARIVEVFLARIGAGRAQERVRHGVAARNAGAPRGRWAFGAAARKDRSAGSRDPGVRARGFLLEVEPIADT
jgi:hypothetical protein